GRRSCQPLPDAAAEGLAEEDDADHHQQDGEREVVIETPERVHQRAADAAGPHAADDGGSSQVAVELIDAQAHLSGEHLRGHGVDQDLEEAATGCPDRFHLPGVDLFDGLRHQLADAADRVHDQREDAGERPEAHGFDEDDGDYDRVEAARNGDDAPPDEVDEARHNVTRGEDPEQDAEDHPDERGEDGDLDALDEPVDHQRA